MELKAARCKLRESHGEEIQVLKAKFKKAKDKYSSMEKEWGLKENYCHYRGEGKEARGLRCCCGG